MKPNQDPQNPIEHLPDPDTIVSVNRGPELLADILPRVIDEIDEVDKDPILGASRKLADMQRQQAKGDPNISDAHIAEARADVEDAIAEQRSATESGT